VGVRVGVPVYSYTWTRTQDFSYVVLDWLIRGHVGVFMFEGLELIHID